MDANLVQHITYLVIGITVRVLVIGLEIIGQTITTLTIVIGLLRVLVQTMPSIT